MSDIAVMVDAGVYARMREVVRAARVIQTLVDHDPETCQYAETGLCDCGVVRFDMALMATADIG